jgi:hypothetical protein
MEPFDYPESLLKLARSITLADLLQGTFTQCHAVSLISSVVSALPYRDNPPEPSEEIMKNLIIELYRSIPYEERCVLFDQCKTLNNRRKEARAK